MKLVKETVNSGIPIWQTAHSPVTAQGGFTLDTTGLTAGEVIKGGSVIDFNESTRIAKVVKSATLTANAANNATTYQVKKGHNFKVGDNLAAATGGAAYAITGINTTNSEYDVLTVGTTLGVALTAGTAVFQSSATGATAAAGTARGLSYEDYLVAENMDISVVIAGVVYERRIPGVPATLKAMIPTIIFSQSF